MFKELLSFRFCVRLWSCRFVRARLFFIPLFNTNLSCDFPPSFVCSRLARCDTRKPVDAYTPRDPYSRRLSDTDDVAALASRVSGSVSKKSKPARVFEEAASTPFEGDIARGDLCAFVAGRADEVDEWTVTVQSIQKFAPGMRVAVAAEVDSVEAYKR